MKIEIDTIAKTIRLLESVKFQELKEYVKKNKLHDYSIFQELTWAYPIITYKEPQMPSPEWVDPYKITCNN